MRFVKINNFQFNLDAIPYYRTTSQRFYVEDSLQVFRLTVEEDKMLADALRKYPEKFLCLSGKNVDLFINIEKTMYFKEMHLITEIRFGGGKMYDHVREPELIQAISDFLKNLEEQVEEAVEPVETAVEEVELVVDAAIEKAESQEEEPVDEVPYEELSPAEKRKRTLAEKKAKESE